MKNRMRIIVVLVLLALIAGIAGCSNSQAADENVEPEEVVEDVVPAEAEEPVEDPVEEELEVVTLTEENLKDFVQFPNLYVQRKEVVDEDGAETDEIVPDVETEDAEAETDVPEAEVTEDEVSETDAELTEGADETSDEMEELVDHDPYGYLAAVKITNPVVVRDITYDDTLVDVRVVGDYELFYLAVVDEDAYNEALLSPVTDISDSDEPSVELPDPEHIICGEIHKVVRIVEPEEYDEMLENGDIIEVVDGTAVLAPESEIVEVDIEDVEFTRPEGYEEPTEGDSYVPSFKDDSGQVIDIPKPPPSGGGGNSGNNNSDNNFDDTESENNTPSPTATEKPTSPTEKPKETETPKPQDTTKPTETTKPAETPAPTATPHTHTWVQETVSDGHYESQKTGTTQVQVGTTTVVDSAAWDESTPGYVQCLTCGKHYATADEWGDWDECGGGYTIVSGQTIHHDAVTHEEPVYETQDVYEDVWVDTSYTIERCSGCGATR